MSLVQLTPNEEYLWDYIRKLENEVVSLRARVKNLEDERTWHQETDTN